jgi:hypothetical protein
MAKTRSPQSPSAVDEAQRWADWWVELNQESFAAERTGKTELMITARTASKMYQQPKLLTTVLEDLESQGSKDRESSNVLHELGAQYLERGELPPEPLRKFLVQVLRAAIKTRSSLVFRNAEIACMLLRLEEWDFPLFPNRDAPRAGQTYARDIVVKAFKKVGINISSATVEKVWKDWSPDVRTFRNEKVRMK